MVTLDLNLVKTVKNSCSQHRAKYVESVLAFVDSPLKMRDIAKELGISYHCVRDILMLVPNYSERVFCNKSRGREGTTYYTGKDNGNYKGHRSSNANGYVLFKMPNWYTGKASGGGKIKYVFEHELIMCAELQLSELPKDYDVHHVNEVKSDNRLENLTLMNRSDHVRLHKGVTTIPLRKYTQVGGSARLWTFNTPDEEIVCSGWRQSAV